MEARRRRRVSTSGYLVGVVALLAGGCTSGGNPSTASTSDALGRSSTPLAATPAACRSSVRSPSTGVDDPDPELRVFDDSPRPAVAWALPVGGIDVDSDQIDGIAVDDHGTTVISGVFHDRVDVGGHELTSRGAGDIFVASIDAAGTVAWVRHYGGSGDDNTYDVEVDGQGDIHLSGWFGATVEFGGTELTAHGDVDAFVAKLSPDGRVIWARSFGGTADAGGNEISVREDGEIAVSVITAGEFAIDDVTYAFGGGGRDAFVLRLAPDGSVRWVHHFDGPGTERIRAVALGPDGDVAVGFEFRGRLRSGGATLDARGGWDGALAHLDADGELDWMSSVAGPGTDNVRGVGIAADGSIYASGTFHGAVRLFDRDQPEVGTGGDDYVAKVATDGTTDWVVTLGGSGSGTGGELQVDPDGVFTSGLLDDEVEVRSGGTTLASLAPPTGRSTGYLLALDASGDPRFMYSPSPEPPAGRAFGDVLEVSENGRVAVQALRFGGTISIAGERFTTPGVKDSAVVFFCLGGP